MKGPVALLHVLPVALLGPWWAGEGPPAPRLHMKRWYAGIAVAVLVAAGVALAWAIPAAIVGGEAFRTEILWRQSAGRIASEGYHARPFWFHLAVLPVILLPWFVFPRAGAAPRRPCASARSPGPGSRSRGLCRSFLAFSLMKGKQVHYLLPEVAGFAVLAALGMAGAIARRRPLALVTAVGSTWIVSAVVLYAVLGPALLKPFDLGSFAGRDRGGAAARAAGRASRRVPR